MDLNAPAAADDRPTPTTHAPPGAAPAARPLAPADAGAIDSRDAETRPLATGTVGRVDGFQIVLSETAYEAIHTHGSGRTDVEVCGLLVGRLYRDDADRPYLFVRDALPGNAADSRGTQVTFTADTWATLHERIEASYPDEKIVGWYHTHPGFGIFLSGMDLFIQDHFFNLPWQVAFVYDPVGGDEGAFVWRGGESLRETFLIEGRQPPAACPAGHTGANASAGDASERDLFGRPRVRRDGSLITRAAASHEHDPPHDAGRWSPLKRLLQRFDNVGKCHPAEPGVNWWRWYDRGNAVLSGVALFAFAFAMGFVMLALFNWARGAV